MASYPSEDGPVDEEHPRTEELRIEQARREAAESADAEHTEGPEAKAHERRAERAAYLREKLEQRGEAEREED
ncbi:MAG: hypothetical protein H0U42_00390 [Thermoleophilaceae bacterium]|nr:hypothetical protein [Thermoleophilaceae bacterium]